MLCQHCKKNVATVHLTEIIDSEKREKHLCEQCAMEEGVAVKGQEPINQLVAKFVLSQAQSEEVADLTCDHCGTTFLQFRKVGLLGCPHDYEAFEKPLLPLLERIHEGNTVHVGKVPGGKDNKQKSQHKLLKLKRQLEDAVAMEDYEQAARLRDQIKVLEES